MEMEQNKDERKFFANILGVVITINDVEKKISKILL